MFVSLKKKKKTSVKPKYRYWQTSTLDRKQHEWFLALEWFKVILYRNAHKRIQ